MSPDSQRQSFPKSLIGILLLFLLSLTFVFGFSMGSSNSSSRSISKISPINGEALQEKVDFDQFWSVWDLVKSEYYKQPVSEEELYYGAMRGMVAGIDDPYTAYFDPKEAEEFASMLEGSFSGIGAQLGIKEDRLVIIASLPKTPAQRAGLGSGDWIVAINEKETAGMSVDEAVSLIRGEEKTTVVLTISQDDGKSVQDFSIIREKIVIDSVKWSVDENNLMTIQISVFNDDTVDLFEQAVQEALQKNVRGIVLDLRGDPGGLLRAAIQISSAWTGFEPVVIEKTRSSTVTHKGVFAQQIQHIKTVVLIDGGSASASEIVSGALQDYQFATLVGTQTFGKGTVQDYQTLDDGSAIKITIAEWFTPLGRTIHEEGLTPDIVVEYTKEDAKAQRDPQLEVAQKILLGTYEIPVQETVAQ